MSWTLLQAGIEVHVIDPGFSDTSSRIATGMIHPVTGRRIARSWEAEKFIPEARKKYKEIETAIKSDFFKEYESLEIYNDAGHRNDWLSRSVLPDFAPFIKGECRPADVPAGIYAPLGGMIVKNGGWLDCNKFILQYRAWLTSNNLISERILYESDVQFDGDHVQWNNITADFFIDCRGAESAKGNWFSYLPFTPTKGEVFRFKSSLTGIDSIHKTVKIVHTDNDNFICGATYSWEDINSHPTLEGIYELTQHVNKVLQVPYKIYSHHAAVRPSTKDRRPFAGRHPVIKQLAILNGLGSKGVMMAPLLAQQLMEHLLNDKPILNEADVRRLHSLYKAQ